MNEITVMVLKQEAHKKNKYRDDQAGKAADNVRGAFRVILNILFSGLRPIITPKFVFHKNGQGYIQFFIIEIPHKIPGFNSYFHLVKIPHDLLADYLVSDRAILNKNFFQAELTRKIGCLGLEIDLSNETNAILDLLSTLDKKLKNWGGYWEIVSCLTNCDQNSLFKSQGDLFDQFIEPSNAGDRPGSYLNRSVQQSPKPTTTNRNVDLPDEMRGTIDSHVIESCLAETLRETGNERPSLTARIPTEEDDLTDDELCRKLSNNLKLKVLKARLIRLNLVGDRSSFEVCQKTKSKVKKMHPDESSHEDMVENFSDYEQVWHSYMSNSNRPDFLEISRIDD